MIGSAPKLPGGQSDPTSHGSISHLSRGLPAAGRPQTFVRDISKHNEKLDVKLAKIKERLRIGGDLLRSSPCAQRGRTRAFACDVARYAKRLIR